jgi:CRISPR system Cascade subunit CasE
VTELIIAKARLRRDVPAVAFVQLLAPAEDDQRVSASHRLLWSLYTDRPDRARDFLWRQTNSGEFLMLGRRVPVDQHGLFELEHKEFAPSLRPGQRLAFNLRANATKRVARGRYVDVVMHALHPLPSAERAKQRARVTHEASAAWLQQQGQRAGFEPVPDALRVRSYEPARIPHGARPISFSVLDLEGELIVCEPETFIAGLAVGFGRAKAFGCGLMLIRAA